MSNDPKNPANPPAPAAPGAPAAPAAPAAPGAKLKPPPLTQEQIAEQILTMRTQHEQLSVSLTQLTHQLTKIQSALKENDQIREKVKTQINDSHHNFVEEFKRKSDLFPEIRFQIIQKAVEVLSPKKK